MRKSRLYSSLFALLSSAAVSAAAAAPIPDVCLACKGETGDAAFMACLDKCINNPSPEAEILPAKPIDLEAAGWTLDTSVNAMTDVKTYYAVKRAENSVRFMMKQVRPMLTIFVRDGRTALSILFEPANIMPTFNENNLAIRIDKNKAFATEAVTNSDNNAVFLDDETILKQMCNGRRALVQVKLFGLNTQSFEFDLTGFDAAYAWCIDAAKAGK